MTTLQTTTVPRLSELSFDGASHDFDFLNGSFEVTNRTLVGKPLTGSDEWKELPATAVAHTHHGGGVSIDEMYFPETRTYGLSFRVFDVESQQWSIYWVSSRDGRLGPPVLGAWRDGSCWLTGEEIIDGVATQVSYSWSNVTDTTAHWEQSYSLDGETWEVNWTMEWVRRTETPDHSVGPKITGEFDFIVGDWQIDHRRLLGRCARTRSGRRTRRRGEPGPTSTARSPSTSSGWRMRRPAG